MHGERLAAVYWIMCFSDEPCTPSDSDVFKKDKSHNWASLYKTDHLFWIKTSRGLAAVSATEKQGGPI
jgi:hypothetical protein